jgi:hypothetical protein
MLFIQKEINNSAIYQQQRYIHNNQRSIQKQSMQKQKQMPDMQRFQAKGLRIGDQENDMTYSGLDEFVGVSGTDRDGDSASSQRSAALSEGLLADPLRRRRIQLHEARTGHGFSKEWTEIGSDCFPRKRFCGLV